MKHSIKLFTLTLTLAVTSLSIGWLHCMKSTKFIDVERQCLTALQSQTIPTGQAGYAWEYVAALGMKEESEFKRLIAAINCSTPETLCSSVHAQITSNPSPLIPYAIVIALDRAEKSICMNDEKHSTALHRAFWYGYRDCALALIVAAKNIGDETLQKLLLMQDDKGLTVLHQVCWYGHILCVKILLVTAQYLGNKILKEFLFTKDNDGDTALHRASYRNHGPCAQALIAVTKGINDETLQNFLAIEDDYKQTALDMANDKNHTTSIHLLKETYKDLGLDV